MTAASPRRHCVKLNTTLVLPLAALLVVGAAGAVPAPGAATPAFHP